MIPNSRREQDKTFAAIYTNFKYHSGEVSTSFLNIHDSFDEFMDLVL